MFIWLANYMRQRLDKCRNTHRARQRERHKKEKELTGERKEEKGRAVQCMHAACLRNEVSKPLLGVAHRQRAYAP